MSQNIFSCISSYKISTTREKKIIKMSSFSCQKTFVTASQCDIGRERRFLGTILMTKVPLHGKSITNLNGIQSRSCRCDDSTKSHFTRVKFIISTARTQRRRGVSTFEIHCGTIWPGHKCQQSAPPMTPRGPTSD